MYCQLNRSVRCRSRYILELLHTFSSIHNYQCPQTGDCFCSKQFTWESRKMSRAFRYVHLDWHAGSSSFKTGIHCYLFSAAQLSSSSHCTLLNRVLVYNSLNNIAEIKQIFSPWTWDQTHVHRKALRRSQWSNTKLELFIIGLDSSWSFAIEPHTFINFWYSIQYIVWSMNQIQYAVDHGAIKGWTFEYMYCFRQM